MPSPRDHADTHPAPPGVWADLLPPDDELLDSLHPAGHTDPQPRPINWETLSAEELESCWLELNTWVDWLRRTYGLPATVIPPAWHRHPELVWELSALHLHWQATYHPDQHASAPHGWHRDLTDALQRLRDWTAASGSRLDVDRPTRHTRWPGEASADDAAVDRALHDRADDFRRHLADQVAQRRTATDAHTTTTP
jgi:hypothetical protein